jgi:hypothetical protein
MASIHFVGTTLFHTAIVSRTVPFRFPTFRVSSGRGIPNQTLHQASLLQMTSTADDKPSPASTEQPGTRYVWMIARPLSSVLPTERASRPGRSALYNLSLAIFLATMHWGVLVTDHGFARVLASFNRAKRTPPSDQPERLGLLFQLKRGVGNMNGHDNVADFGTAQLQGEWKTHSLRYIGLTRLGDEEIKEKGIAKLKLLTYSHRDTREWSKIPSHHSKLPSICIGTHRSNQSSWVLCSAYRCESISSTRDVS